MIAVESEPDDLGTGEVVGQPLEGAPVLVDDRDGVPGRLERAGELASYAPAANDHNVQSGLPVVPAARMLRPSGGSTGNRVRDPPHS